MEIIQGGVCAAEGFAANGVHCGIRKNKIKRDLSLIFSEVQANAASVYTTNLVKGAPLTVTKNNSPVCTVLPVCYKLMGSVIEDHAVGEHFHDRTALMFSSLHHDFRSKFQFRVKASCKESALCTEYKASRIERMLDCTVWGCLGYCPKL